MVSQLVVCMWSLKQNSLQPGWLLLFAGTRPFGAGLDICAYQTCMHSSAKPWGFGALELVSRLVCVSYMYL